MAKELSIAFGKNNLGLVKDQTSFTWSEFRRSYLSEFHVHEATVAEYATFSREEKMRVKNSVGWFVAGAFKRLSNKKNSARWRNLEGLHHRSAIVLDIDHLAEFEYTVNDVIELMDIVGCTYSLYSTPSSTDKDIRLRLVVPLARAISPAMYQPIGRWIAGEIGIDIFDSTGFEEARLMFRPVALSDGPKVMHHVSGKRLNPKKVLATYEDWRDFGSWPSSIAEGGARVSAEKAEDPTLKEGAIGAFCRSFNIHDVISNWLSDFFQQTDENTYLPTDSTGAPGARVYDDELFLYNNHETGPTSKRNLNAFDLCRVLLFGDQDADVENDAPINEHPSYTAMLNFAQQQPRVVADLAGEEFSEDMGDGLGEGAGELTNPRLDAAVKFIDDIPDKQGSRFQLKSAMNTIAQHGFSPVDTRTLLSKLKRKYQEAISISVLEKELREARRGLHKVTDDGEIHDLELELISEFEHEHYPGGTIKRVGKKFWVFRHGYWRMVDDEIILGQFSQTVIRIRKERPDDAREISAMVGETKTSALAGALHKLMCGLIAQRDSKSEDPLHLMRRYKLPVINCRNCELHFKEDGSFTVEEHNPENFFTIRIDAEFDPEAQCPTYDKFIARAFAKDIDPEAMVEFANEIGGYTVQMSRWLKIWVMLIGDTDTGKTTFSECITSLLGGASSERKLSAISSTGGSQFKDEGSIGKLLTLDDDLDKGFMLPDGDIKRVSEEKVIQTQVKFANDVRYVNLAFPMICTNHWPRTADISDALVNRTMTLRFGNPYKVGVDADDGAKHRMLNDERSGILNRFIEGLSRLRKRGYFEPPIDSLKSRGEWLQHANPVAGFITNCLAKDASGKIKPADLHEAYLSWHYDEYGGTGFKPLPKQEFYRRCDAKLGGRRKAFKDGSAAYVGWRVTATFVDDFGEEPDALNDFDDLLT